MKCDIKKYGKCGIDGCKCDAVDCQYLIALKYVEKARKIVIRRIKEKIKKETDRRVKYQHKMKSQGRCVICGKPAINESTRCQEHREYGRQRYLKMKESKKG